VVRVFRSFDVGALALTARGLCLNVIATNIMMLGPPVSFGVGPMSVEMHVFLDRV
jgi:flagellar basal body rod protein FlgC